jgi:hypothetical protein
MKPTPAPVVAGNTPWERLDSAVRQIFTVTKENAIQADTKRKRAKARKLRLAKP